MSDVCLFKIDPWWLWCGDVNATPVQFMAILVFVLNIKPLLLVAAVWLLLLLVVCLLIFFVLLLLLFSSSSLLLLFF